MYNLSYIASYNYAKDFPVYKQTGRKKWPSSSKISSI